MYLKEKHGIARGLGVVWDSRKRAALCKYMLRIMVVNLYFQAYNLFLAEMLFHGKQT